MPHKHTRSSRQTDSSNYDLPPSSIARPLPVAKSLSSKESSKKKRKRSRECHDDTPRAFARVINYQKNGHKPQSLDNGDHGSNKKRKLSSQPQSEGVQFADLNTNAEDASAPSKRKEKLAILPGERLSDFSARVNQAKPISGLTRKNKEIQKLGLGKALKERQTKMEKRMQRMQAQWREEEAKIKEREEEARELAEEAEEEHWGASGSLRDDTHRAGHSKRKRRQGGAMGAVADGEDPWAQLKLVRQQPRGLNDYAKEPPKLIQVREKLKLRNGAIVDVTNVPEAAGSLRRREELGTTRRDIIETYRKMMKAKRTA